VRCTDWTLHERRFCKTTSTTIVRTHRKGGVAVNETWVPSAQGHFIRRLRRGVQAALFAVMCSVTFAGGSGCAWKPEIIYVDPALTSNDLVTGKIAVMPVKFDNEKAIPNERFKTVQSLVRAIQQLRKDIPMTTNDSHTKALNLALEEEAQWLRVYDYDPTNPKPELLQQYRETLAARYLILSRLNYDQRTGGGGGKMPSSTTESTLSGRVSILDMTTGRTVWEGEFSSTRGGMDTISDPRPSAHALPFFSTIVKAWPGGPT
jgi:hypothetical protein